MEKITKKQLLFIVIYSIFHFFLSFCLIFGLASPNASPLIIFLKYIGLLFIFINLPITLLTGDGSSPTGFVLAAVIYAFLFLYIYKFFFKNNSLNNQEKQKSLKYHLFILIGLMTPIFLLRIYTIYFSIKHKQAQKKQRIETSTRTGYHKIYDHRKGLTENLKEEGNWLNGKREGLHRFYFAGGELDTESMFLDGKLDGIFKSYYPDGKISFDNIYSNGKLIESKHYNKSGNLISKMKYDVDNKSTWKKIYVYDEDGQLFSDNEYVTKPD